MHILRLLRDSGLPPPTSILVITGLAALGNAALIALVNLAAQQASTGAPDTTVLVPLYIGLFAFFYVANRMSLRETNRYVQHCLARLRLRLADKIRRSPLRSLETIGHGQLLAVVAQETSHLSQNLPLFVGAMQSAVLLAFVLLYVAVLSPISFVLLGSLLIAGLYGFWRGRVALNRSMGAVYGHEAGMLDSMSAFTKGFTEIRLNAARNDALFARFTQVVDGLERAVVAIGGRWVALLHFSNVFLYFLIGIVIFALPVFFHGYTDVIYKIVAATIFCTGPLISITAVTHLYARAEIGLGHTYALEALLDREARPLAPAAPSRFSGFKTIEARDLTLAYRGPDGAPLFTLGPLDLTLARGETLFLTGGNGSGKSTAVRLLCGLYAPDGGQIMVDGVPVTPEASQEYRELFAAVFPDFHLFDRLHGLSHVPPQDVTALIARMGLADKVRFEKGRFSTADLSTGQRKRLALIAALLEEREIYLFDEWAADQDPHFREAFYTEILPELRRQGRTVIAVTHDDRYFHCATRRVELEFGRVRAEHAGEVA
ncbi:cyclic peptide export ABC transporter [Xanthobacteraceae bacterium A53D]